ncbi:hypothetical protein BS47DRAFT_1378816 [Hydnum rufescens UP504]|uniref:Uncharacterized protein n=1 Tax=Hydnum rufescens UP504 TaxID=1448309 RepID=A0A9P6BB70_9AGAM|nr:hypothetical protein BS47DRAFT_1378816 [Hydnum rufescens UP504]
MPNSAVTVHVRIEGRERTLFEDTSSANGGYVTTTHGTTPVSGPADGTNANEYPFPVPTATSALAYVATGAGARPKWGAAYSRALDDFVISTIGDTASADEGWRLFVNFKPTEKTGSRTLVKTGDSVLWALVPAAAASVPLRLHGPRTATVNVAFTVTVLNGSTGAAVNEAIVGGQTTNANGQATITVRTAGTR